MPNQPIVTAGLVLRETVTRETDKILTVLTPDRGRSPSLHGAPGGKQPSGGGVSVAGLFGADHLRKGSVVHAGRGGDAGAVHRPADGLRGSEPCLLSGRSDGRHGTGEDTSQLLRLLLNALYALSVLHKPPQLVKPAFELRLMALSGFEPLADGCAVCGRPEPEKPVLDAVHGVVCCAACREKGGLAMPLSPAALAALRHVLYCPDKKLYSFTLDTPALRQLGQAAEVYVAAQLERSFRTLDYYKSILPQEEPTYD